MPIGMVDKAVTRNGFLAPSMRHQRLYIDILGGSEKLEKEKRRCSGGGRLERGPVNGYISKK
jgi:hypothetical protein